MNTRIKIKKGLLQKSKKWYCWFCRDFTKSVKGKNGVIKCLCCVRKSYIDGYNCPECGADTRGDDGICMVDTCQYEHEEKTIADYLLNPCEDCIHFTSFKGTLISISDKRHVSTTDYSGYEWLEEHKCWNCGTIYEFYNSSF